MQPILFHAHRAILCYVTGWITINTGAAQYLASFKRKALLDNIYPSHRLTFKMERRVRWKRWKKAIKIISCKLLVDILFLGLLVTWVLRNHETNRMMFQTVIHFEFFFTSLLECLGPLKAEISGLDIKLDVCRTNASKCKIWRQDFFVELLPNPGNAWFLQVQLLLNFPFFWMPRNAVIWFYN